MKAIKTTGLLMAMLIVSSCVNESNKTSLIGATANTEKQTAEGDIVVGIVGDGTSMHALELITLDTGDSLYFTYEVNSTDGIEIGDTIRVTYDFEQGDVAAIEIEKLN